MSSSFSPARSLELVRMAPFGDGMKWIMRAPETEASEGLRCSGKGAAGIASPFVSSARAPSLRLACCLFASLRAASSKSGLRSAYFAICPPRSPPNAFADGLRCAAKVASPTVAPRGFGRPLGLSKARSSVAWNVASSATLRACKRARTSCICGVKRKGKKKTCVEVRCWLCIFQFLIRLFL